MSSLGDLLLAHLKPDESSPQNDDQSTNKVLTERIEESNDVDNHSNASSTDDYVRELLDPDDRPRNVWHVVEGPTNGQNTDRSKSNSYDGQDSNRGEAIDQGIAPNIHYGENISQRCQSEGINMYLEPADAITIDEKTDINEECVHDEPSDASQGQNENSGKVDGKQVIDDKVRDKSSRRHRHREGYDGGDRHNARDKERDRHRERVRGRHGSKTRDDYSRNRDRHRSHRKYDHSDEEADSRHRSHRGGGRSRSRSRVSSRRHERSRSNSQSPISKRNSRTILVMQLSPKIRSTDLEEFFSDIGKVREVRLIMDSKTRKHKGIAYIEFEDAATATKAFTVNGKKFFGAPIIIQSAQLDRHRSSADWHSSSTSQTVNYALSHTNSRPHLPPNCYRVYVGGLNVNLTEDMIRSVFEPFGPIVRLELMRDRVTNIPRGYAFITYAYIEDGQNAVKCLDGLELGGKAIRVSKSTDKCERTTTSTEAEPGRVSNHDSDLESRTSKTKDVTASLYELAGHQSY